MALIQTTRKMLAPVTRSVSRFSTAAAQKGQQKQKYAVPDFGIAKESGFDLPPMNSIKDVPQQGWHMNTIVRPSTVPAAGNGRFATEHVKAKSTVIQKLLMPMAKIHTLVGLSNDIVITFSRVDDLEKYIELSMSDGGHSRQEVLNVFENFVFGFDGQRACLSVSTMSLNHADHAKEGLNVEMVERTLPGGFTAYCGEALSDIQVNDELFEDYRKFVLPQFYLTYSKENGFKDVRTATMETVYGGCYTAMEKRQTLSLPVYNKSVLPSKQYAPFRGSVWKGL